MRKVYIDPSSRYFLGNILFSKDPVYNQDDRLLTWRFLKQYCAEKGIEVNTIDFWQKNKSSPEDIYFSIDHKNFVQKLSWYLKNNRYPLIDRNIFKKRILFQLEPPMVMPEVYEKINNIAKGYDEVFLTYKVDNPKCRYLPYPKIYSNVIPEYWQNTDRKFLTMINLNKRPRLFRLLKIYVNRKLGQLLTERLKIISFFSRNNEIDLYGLDWEKFPPFPYCHYKSAIQKVWKGPVNSKFKILSEYTFAIAFENSIFPGFIGEVITDCFYSGTVPIYLGAPDIEKYVSKECFIDMRDFKNYEELRQFLKSLSEDEIRKYRENARHFLESEKFKPFTKEYFAEIFVKSILN